MNVFGNRSKFLTKCQISQRLVDYVIRKLRKKGSLGIPTQEEIGEEIGVSQSMVSAVIAGRRSFARDSFKFVAARESLSEGELFERLLIVDSARADCEAIGEAERSQGLSRTLLTRGFGLWNRLDAERFIVATNPELAFDSDRAVTEILLSFVGIARQFGLRLAGAAFLSLIGDEVSVFGAPRDATGLSECHRTTLKATTKWRRLLGNATCHREFNGTIDVSPAYSEKWDRSIDPRGANCALLGGTARSSQCVEWISMFSVTSFSTSSVDKREHRMALAVVLADDASDPSLDESATFFARVAERVAFYDIGDRLMCAELVLSEDSRAPAVLRDVFGGAMKRTIEPMEASAQKLLRNICEHRNESRFIVAADIWLYDNSSRAFVSPSERFRHVGTAHREERMSTEAGVVETVRELYERVFPQFRPRPAGKTTYMIANRRGLIVIRRETSGDSRVWNGSREFSLGTYVGIPFLIQSRQHSLPPYAGVLSVRCVERISLSKAKAVFTRVCAEMAKVRGCEVTPLLADDDFSTLRGDAGYAGTLFSRCVEWIVKQTRFGDVYVEGHFRHQSHDERGPGPQKGSLPSGKQAKPRK